MRQVLQIGILSAAIAAVVTIIPILFDRSFFVIDDAANQNLGFYKEVGRLVLSGELPILTNKTMLGGNLLVDMVISPFSLQTILTGIVAVIFNNVLAPVAFLAWFNAFIISAGCYYLGKALRLTTVYSSLLALLVSTSPIYLYIFAASWWNLASAFANFVLAVASLFNFINRPQRVPYAVAAICGALQFTTAGTQAHLAYLICAGILVLHSIIVRRSVVLALALVSIVAISLSLTGIPLYAEYLASSDIITRYSSFSNHDNFLVPSLASFVLCFNPYYFSFIHWFGGYRHLPIALGYAGLICLPAVVFLRPKTTITDSRCSAIVSCAIVLALLALSCHQLGPLRWPFRFIPFASMFFSVLAVYIVSRSDLDTSYPRKVLYIVTAAIGGWIAFFSQEDLIFNSMNFTLTVVYLVSTAAVLAVILMPHLASRPNLQGIYLLLIHLMLWLVLLLSTNSLAPKYLTKRYMGEVWRDTFSSGGYVLGLKPGESANEPSTAACAQFLYHGANSINGYSPVGHAAFGRLFPHGSAHGLFREKETLLNICRDAEGFAGRFVWELFGINTIYASSDAIDGQIGASLEKAGLRVETLPNDPNRVVLKPDRVFSRQGSLSCATEELVAVSLPGATNRHEQWTIEARDSPVTVVFSRLWWKGYSATLGRMSLPVSNWQETLLKVEIPPGPKNVLELSYTPISWKYTRWSILTGLSLLGFSLFLLPRVSQASRGGGPKKNS